MQSLKCTVRSVYFTWGRGKGKYWERAISKVRTCVHHKEEKEAPNLVGRNKKQILTNVKEIMVLPFFNSSSTFENHTLPFLSNIIHLDNHESEPMKNKVIPPSKNDLVGTKGFWELGITLITVCYSQWPKQNGTPRESGGGVNTFVILKRMVLPAPRIKWMLLEVPMARAEAEFQDAADIWRKNSLWERGRLCCSLLQAWK